MEQPFDVNQISQTEYVRALRRVVETRLQRKKLYGDGFLQNSDRFFMTMIEEKIKRAVYLFDNPPADKTAQYEKIEDTLVDLANYSMMWLENIERRKGK